MAEITRPKAPPVYHADRPNAVLAVAEAKLVCVKFTDPSGQEEMALCLVFGTNNEDGGTGVWVMANQEEMMKTLRIAGKHVRRGVRASLALDDPGVDDLPANIPVVDVTGEGVGSLAEGNALDTLDL